MDREAATPPLWTLIGWYWAAAVAINAIEGSLAAPLFLIGVACIVVRHTWPRLRLTRVTAREDRRLRVLASLPTQDLRERYPADDRGSTS